MHEFQALANIPCYWAERQPQREAMSMGGRSVSYLQLAHRTRAISGYLAGLGLRPGDRVVYLGRNDDNQLLLFFACARMSLRLVLPNWRLSARELHELLRDAEAAALFATVECAHLVSGIRWGAGMRLLSSSVLESVPDPGVVLADPIETAGVDTDLMLCYTSGSTGKPKGVRQTHGNWLAAIRMAAAWPGGGWHERSRALCTLPFFHVAGLRSAVLAIAFGGTAVFPEDSSAAALQALVQQERITTMSVVPTLLKSLIETGEAPQEKLSSLETVFYGAAPMPAALLAHARSLLGCAFVQTYGATETTGIALALDDEHHFPPLEKQATCGMPLPGMRVDIRDAGGTTLPAGEPGQVWLKGPSIARGYWKQEGATARSFVDGWFVPGDLGRLDADGFLVLEGRSSDVIKSGGEKVHPNEVERVLLEHPGVEDAAVYGLQDATWGERVCATIVPLPGAGPDLQDILAFCRGRLASFKIPRQIDAVAALPRNSGGKVLRSVLQAERTPVAAGPKVY